ncbi:peroxiredoxin [Bradyrhizobium lablabi]|uniref:peroxiredoxin n=1 Tax=Bradyrhizobium lablabi TaxID=722472 RepID=UPI001BA49AA7|nr:peroxiredoxin [Bradyrhizobium lablabi]MBR1122559.1 peroxiredoxin [Bradyrhizobium lablabi]
MSKKTRKNSPKTSARAAASKKASVRSPSTKKASAAKTGKKAAASPEKSRPKASQKAASKPLKSAGSAAPGLAEGAKAPAFRLPRDGGDTVSLADYAGKKLVLFFYPRADTPGCTREAIDFTRLRSAFEDAGTAVLGVSADTVKAQDAFRSKHQLAIPLISDEQHEMLEAYGAWGEKSLYGRTFLGIIRTTVLIGQDGRVARIWRNVRVDGHADQVLEAARAL